MTILKSSFPIALPYYFPSETEDLGDNTDDNTEDDTKDKLEDELDKDDDEEEEEKENEEEEDEETEEDDDKEDKEDELTRISYKDLKTIKEGKYKDLFKDVPELREAFFREQKFTEIFPTVEQAEEALEAQENFEQIRGVVISGDVSTFLTQLNDASPKALQLFVKNFLPTLQKSSKYLFVKTTTPIVRQVLNEVLKEGKSKGDSDDGKRIRNAAKIVHKVLFGGDYEDIDKGLFTNNGDKESKDKEEDSEDRKQLKVFYAQRYNDLMEDVANTADEKLQKEIDKDIDPTNSIKSKYLRKKLVEEVAEKVREAMNADKAHTSRMNSYWAREQRNGFSGTMKDSMITAFLSRAKILIPKIRAEVRKNALGSQKKKDEENSERIQNRKDKITPGGGGGKKGKDVSITEAREKGMSMRELLDS